MNICMIAYTRYDADARVMRQAEALASRGDHVDVIALRSPREQEVAQSFSGVTVYRVQRRKDEEIGRTAYVLQVTGFMLRAAWWLIRRHRKIHYDLIYVHSVPDFLVFAATFQKLTGSRVVLDIHDLLPEFYVSKFGNRWTFVLCKLVERISCALADHVVVANDMWRDRVISRRSVRAETCTALLNYPDQTIFRRNADDCRRGTTFKIIYPGSLNRHQGLDIALRAMAEIKDAAPQAEFHIYGERGTKRELMELRSGLGLQDRVHFHRPLPLREIAGKMAASDLAVVPKRNDSFGRQAFSTKVLELMCLGVPVILADTDIDKHYFNLTLVRFFRSGDAKDLGRCILELIGSPELRRELARNSLQFVQQHTWQMNRYRYLNLIDSLTKGRSLEGPIASNPHRPSPVHGSLLD